MKSKLDILIVKFSQYFASIPSRLAILCLGLPFLIFCSVVFIFFGEIDSIFEE